VVRDYAPDVQFVECAALEDNVGRIQQAGADFALSVSQVAGQLLTHHILGEMVSQQAHIKLVKRGASKLVGRHPLESSIRERTGCTIVAVERDGEVIMDIPSAFTLTAEDELYICGTVDALNRFYEAFTESQG
jgi:voltage-gated potassium channel